MKNSSLHCFAGELVRPGVGADHEGAGAGHRGRDREHHVRPDDPGDEIDLVLLQHLVGDLLAHVGLVLVVAVDDLGIESADPALQVVEREFDRVLHVFADVAVGAGERGDEADFQFLLAECGRGDRH